MKKRIRELYDLHEIDFDWWYGLFQRKKLKVNRLRNVGMSVERYLRQRQSLSPGFPDHQIYGISL